MKLIVKVLTPFPSLRSAFVACLPSDDQGVRKVIESWNRSDTPAQHDKTWPFYFSLVKFLLIDNDVMDIVEEVISGRHGPSRVCDMLEELTAYCW